MPAAALTSLLTRVALPGRGLKQTTAGFVLSDPVANKMAVPANRARMSQLARPGIARSGSSRPICSTARA